MKTTIFLTKIFISTIYFGIKSLGSMKWAGVCLILLSFSLAINGFTLRYESLKTFNIHTLHIAIMLLLAALLFLYCGSYLLLKSKRNG